MKNPEAHAFVHECMAELGVRTPRELARALGVDQRDEERKINRWVSGDSAPDFSGTMFLLRATGRLKQTGSPALEVTDAASSAPDPQSVGVGLAALTREVRSGFEKIGKRLDRLEQRQPGEDPQAQPKKQRAG